MKITSVISSEKSTRYVMRVENNSYCNFPYVGVWDTDRVSYVGERVFATGDGRDQIAAQVAELNAAIDKFNADMIAEGW
jgi:hypothetical protein